MIWTIAWVTVVALAVSLLALWGTRTDRSIGGVAIAVAAFGWAFVRWAWIDVNWFLIRPLGGDWVWLIIILLITSLVIAFVWWRVAKLIGLISLFFAVLIPFGDLFSEKLWSWPAAVIVIVIIMCVIATRMMMTSSVAIKDGGLALLVSAVIVAVVCFGSIWLFGGDSDSPSARADEQTSSASTPNATATVTETAKPAGLDEDKLANMFARTFKKLGFKPGDVTVGNVDWANNPIDHRRGAFGDGVKSQEELTEFLNSDAPEGQAARRHVLKATPGSEHERVLNGDNYIPVQYNVDIQYGGNTTWTNGKLMRGGKVVAEAGDVFWVFVGSDYTIYWDAAVRADCENPGLTSPPRPHRSPDIECVDCQPPPTCEDLGNCQPPPTCEDLGNCLEDKNPEQDPAQNGNAPTGGGHNDTNGPGQPNPQPTFPTQPHQNPPPPPPPAPSPTPSPTQPPEGGGSDGGQDNPPGDPGMP